MKRLFITAILLLFLLISNSFGLNQGRFMKEPDVNGSKIVFSYEGDLWLVSTSGGTASRLTTAPGNEYSPKFSPDGSLIAFSGNYDGSNNVYVMPTEGGEPKRVTYIPGSSQTITWTPDGKRIVFSSFYENFIMRGT